MDYTKMGFLPLRLEKIISVIRILPTAYTRSFLEQIARYTDGNTKIGLGSCYGGATFIHPGSATVKSGPMKCDSLMIGMGKIFKQSTIYTSSGWVMMKPGIFSDNFGFAGCPLGKRYRTEYRRPVWDHLGNGMPIQQKIIVLKCEHCSSVLNWRN